MPEKSHMSPLNSDLLSEIFICCSQSDWRSPVTLAAVCRLWREIIYTTPRVWQSFRNQDNSEVLDDDQTSAWLDRSRHLPLHMHIAKRCSPQRAQIVLMRKDRFECLTIQHRFNYLQIEYPRLQSLALFDDFWFEPYFEENTRQPGSNPGEGTTWSVILAVSTITRKRFPALRTLSVMSRSQKFAELTMEPGFPRLSELDLRVRDLKAWGGHLSHCADTLVSLIFEAYPGDSNLILSNEPEVLDLPKLRYLSLDFSWARLTHLPFIFATPVLEVMDATCVYESNRHKEYVYTANVTDLAYYDRAPLDLDMFPSLRRLSIAHDNLERVWNDLINNDQLCPSLSSIQSLTFDRDIVQLPTQRVRMDRSVEIMVLHRREVSWKKNFISDFRAQTCEHCLRI
ncbi:hypothetical protein M408DRAFT_333457 [Serendipita vermifera MAFF 305830]|uniref:Uncharacterized protein n=1 Tax=Serendipita vermifera MAFF 305830 TaxID=933852 RepID=A0A0C2WVM2_SERVB|nr:hypothetical protein M408DRAFT_333457 [Serendipita vermifera MAFF 305830]